MQRAGWLSMAVALGVVAYFLALLVLGVRTTAFRLHTD